MELTMLSFVLVFLCFSLVLFIATFGKEKNLPPGRKGWPIIGALGIFAGKKTLLEHFLDLHKEYGTDVTSIRLAGKYIVCLNTYDVIKDVLQRKDFTNRADLTLMRVDPEYRGVIHASGEIWRDHRRFCLRTLRDFGMGKSDGEILIKKEIKHLIAHITEHLNTPVETSAVISPAVNNTMCLFLFGKRYPYDDFESFDRLRELDRLMMTIVPMWKPFLYTPYLLHIPGDLFGYKESRRRLHLFYAFIEEQIRDREEKSFITTFIEERNRQLEEGIETTFTENQLKYTIMDFFMAGTDTTTTFIRWAILILAQYPKLQVKLHHEIYRKLGLEEVSMIDKIHLPLVEAFILEVHRFASISPIGLPHTCEHDTEIHGYDIPKGSSVFANIYAVHRDPKYWKNADEFDLENFLDGNGNVVHDQRLLPFSIGKRTCVGEALAKMEIFLILVNLVQKFRFKLSESFVSLQGNLEGMNYPPPHRILITERSVLNGPLTPDPRTDLKPVFPVLDKTN